ncbi:uncharacterized protein GVI51_M00209 [Nakaseomyces glabratus]|uniref:Uncharacterized protein n=1 Tax=Candida glabrata (strain ATCC 2001 / BCRC 20586 / JCM 3761 / NBRC 0622 / NRRL Y-65 / CBS 138) TaxID=284593 RepID=Q6FK86_CANGA|nr:uncharacterized protein CAGL0M00308g [Nakaseomyces glabratus]KAH7593538.1 hypothetical protein J7294_04683 [Nakaseomyces glabratus]KAH7599989.1 hypothetical protein J7293_04675 [Nakaseomyces glabratus]QHS69038.1 uncharacterized protein GVI51_M00209 [Nakaseomyces glabratus]CAG62334.1 unnamed protein product [Nakaseomyces glabratus]|eukprot:XP_449358.1 uncharacterized protein CAGL0M00308g [[Candida] glabrata]
MSTKPIVNEFERTEVRDEITLERDERPGEKSFVIGLTPRSLFSHCVKFHALLATFSSMCDIPITFSAANLEIQLSSSPQQTVNYKPNALKSKNQLPKTHLWLEP